MLARDLAAIFEAAPARPAQCRGEQGDHDHGADHDQHDCDCAHGRFPSWSVNGRPVPCGDFYPSVRRPNRRGVVGKVEVMTGAGDRPEAPDGVAFESRAGRWVLAVSVLGSGLAFLDGTVVNVALPDIGRDLGATTSSLQWILNGYLLTLASLILLGGSLGDRHGRRRIFVLGVWLFTAASLLCAVAPSAELLIFARLIQGVGGALLTPGSLALIEASFRPGDRARAIGAWSGLGGVATALGPLLGGYLIGAISWRAIFVINMPIGIFVAWAATRHVPESRDPMATGRLD